MRCEVCGRPYDGETLKAREIVCQGCHAEYEALKLVVDAEGARTHTDAQALAAARAGHYKREETALAAKILARYENNAAGKDADDPDTALAATGAELTAIKAHAAEVVRLLKRVG